MKENKIRQFINEMFGEITVLQSQDDDRVWFIVDEIYTKLGYSKAQDLYSKCDNEEISTYVLTVNGKRQGARDIKTIITFDGLMDACGSARGERKEIWKKFRKWINNTVIPNLYKDGMYVNGEEDCETQEELEQLIDEATEWKIMRKYGIGVRNDLTGNIKLHINPSNSRLYGTITDQFVYKPIFGKTAKQMREQFGVKKLRDDLFTTQELSDIAKQEDFVDRLIVALGDYHKIKEIVLAAH